MFEPTTSLGSFAAIALGIVFCLWTFFICKLIFLGKPRNVSLRFLGVTIDVKSPVCVVHDCESNKDKE